MANNLVFYLFPKSLATGSHSGHKEWEAAREKELFLKLWSEGEDKTECESANWREKADCLRSVYRQKRQDVDKE